MAPLRTEQQRRVDTASHDTGLLRATVHQHAETAHVRIVPRLLRHLAAVRIDPGHVLDVDGFVDSAGEEAGSPQDRVAPAQPHQLAEELRQAACAIGLGPVEPADFVVLSIGVVVAALRTLAFVARKHHRRSLREQKRREEIAHLPVAQCDDAGIVGRTFRAAVP